MYLNFIIIFLQPFDTSQYEADHKNLLLSGFGLVVFAVFVLYNRVENLWYERAGRFWTVQNEIASVLLFCFFAGSIVYVYNRIVVNAVGLAWDTYMRFIVVTVICMLPVFVPPMVYLRQRFGQLIVPVPAGSTMIAGANKNEMLQLENHRLLFVRAVENYVEICFIGTNGQAASKTFRQTLSNISAQMPSLEKCHRSYLVNVEAISQISGNSQAAKIHFGIEGKEIPLSKTFYKHIRNLVSEQTV